jgi:hypothetical protein
MKDLNEAKHKIVELESALEQAKFDAERQKEDIDTMHESIQSWRSDVDRLKEKNLKTIKEKQYWKNRCSELTKQHELQKQNDLKFIKAVGVNYGKLERENKKLTERIEQLENPEPKLHDLLMNKNQLTIEDVIDEVNPPMLHEDCNECNGEGQIWHDTSSSCMTAPSECCGGCGYDTICLTCEGKGSVELWQDEEPTKPEQ